MRGLKGEERLLPDGPTIAEPERFMDDLRERPQREQER